MRAIIINDNDARDLVQRLELCKFTSNKNVNLETLDGRKTVEVLAEEIYQKFHYEVVRWLHDQGARLIR